MDPVEATSAESLFDRPRWWAPKAIFWISIAVFAMGTLVAFGTAMSSYQEAAADPARSQGASLLAAIFQFVWVFISSCFWAILVICFGRGFDKLDELVWLAASPADRREIVRRRGGRPKTKGGWRSPDSKP